MLETLLEVWLSNIFCKGGVVKGCSLAWIGVEGWISSVVWWGWLLSVLAPSSSVWN